MVKRVNNDDNPFIVIEGMEDVIEKDLGKHEEILAQTRVELDKYRQAVSHEVKKKKYYKSLIGGGKYNDEALKKSIGQIQINIRHLSDKSKLAQGKIEHETLIVDTLTKQLDEQLEGVKKLAEYKMKQAARDAINNRLGESSN